MILCVLLRIMKLELYAVPKVYSWFNVVSIVNLKIVTTIKKIYIKTTHF